MISPRPGDTEETRVMMELCVFSSNLVVESGGGAIFVDALGTQGLSKLWLYSCRFYSNSDSNWGKAPQGASFLWLFAA